MKKINPAVFAFNKLIPFCISQNSNFLVSAHHRTIARALQKVETGEIKRLIITAPPRHGKSYLVSQMFPAWYLGRNPEKYVIQASYGQDLSSDFGRFVRNSIMSDEFKGIFSGVSVETDSKSQKRFNTNKNGSYFAVGRGGSITGRGGNIIIIDDLLKNDQEAHSEKIRHAMIEWYKNTLYTRLMPGGAIIIINTRWHEDDLIGRLLKDSDEDWTQINFPAIDESGKALWPDYFSVDTLLKTKKEIGLKAFESLYQQNPSPEEGQIVKKDWIHHWKALPPQYQETIMSWDLAFKGTSTSDYVVGQMWGRWGADFFLLDQVRGKWDFTQTVRQVELFAIKHMNYGRILIEDKANGPAVMNVLKNKIPGIVPYKPDSDKASRLHSVTPLFESGNVFIPPIDKFDWVREYVHELTSFPSAKHDDQVDATTQALHILRKRTTEQYAVSGSSIFS